MEAEKAVDREIQLNRIVLLIDLEIVWRGRFIS